MGAISSRVSAHPLIAFTLLAYGISWLLLLPLMLSGQAHSTFGLLLVIASAFGPTAAGAIVTAMRKGVSGLRQWLGRITTWRIHLRWYGLALLLPVLIIALGYGIYLLLGGAPLTDWRAPSPLIYAATVLFIALLAGGQEEVGWRGFALRRLQAKYSAFTSSLILSLIWAGWHLPLFSIPGTTQSGLPITWYLALIPAVSLLLTWLFNSSGGSVLPAMLFHAGVNTSPGLIPIDQVSGSLRILDTVLAAIWIIVFIVVAKYGPEDLASRSRSKTANAESHAPHPAAKARQIPGSVSASSGDSPVRNA
jgi:membrane protease YdiL (CAAX protease family)